VSWPSWPVTVTVPATSANLGPGFDALGLALGLHDVVQARILPAGLAIEVSGLGGAAESTGEDHLVIRAMRAGFDALGGQPPGIGIRCANAIPQGYGLGSSAGAIVAGLLAARALAGQPGATTLPDEAVLPGGVLPGGVLPGGPLPGSAPPGSAPPGGVLPGGPLPGSAPPGGPLPDGAVLRLAARLEGHPDNVSACLAGGLTIAWQSASGVASVRLSPLAGLAPVICVPSEPLATSAARQVLPRAVPHADAAANSARAALLIAALTDNGELLMDATQDFLHQRYREAAMPRTARLVAALRAAGVPAVVSGAGPSVLALTVTGLHPALPAVESISRATGSGWRVLLLAVDRQGAAVQQGLG
jgi:homoserine kinase